MWSIAIFSVLLYSYTDRDIEGGMDMVWINWGEGTEGIFFVALFFNFYTLYGSY